MKRFNYSDNEIDHLIKANTKLVDRNKDLEKYNKELEEKLNKILETINNWTSDPNAFGHYAIDGDCKKYLLSIIKGEEYEEVKDIFSFI